MTTAMADSMRTRTPVRRRADGERMLFRPTERFLLDPKSPVPLYHQMEQIILDRIEQEDAVGRVLPREMDLVEIFGVSRATIKRVTDSLVAKGLIERKRAVGTRVVSSTVTEDLGRLKSYSELMHNAGLTSTTEVISVETIEADEHLRRRLRVDDGEKILSLRRLRGTSKVFPVVLLHSQIPERYDIRCDEDFACSLYRLLEETYRIPIEWAEEHISAGHASGEEAEYLNIAAGDTVLIMERLTFTRGDRPLEFVRAVYVPEHYTFSIRLRR